MSPLNKTYTHYLYKIVGLICSIVLVAALAGWGQVLLRERISKKAAQVSRYESKLAGLERQIQDYDTRIAQVHNPETLKTYAANFGLNMKLPDSGQVVLLQEPVYHHIDVTEGNPEYAVAKARDPFKVTFDLAVIEASKTKK